MKIKEGMEEEYKKAVEINDDGYGKRIHEFAKDWAEFMEARMEKGEKLKDIAKECGTKADFDGITGFMYGAVVTVLGGFWEHGDQLVRWHNHEETGVCSKNPVPKNPAILEIGVPDK